MIPSKFGANPIKWFPHKKRDKICGKNISIDTIITITYLSLMLILKGKLHF